MADEDRTKKELQQELRKRDLPVSGSKSELAERLRDALEQSAASESSSGDEASAQDEQQSSEEQMSSAQESQQQESQQQEASGQEASGQESSRGEGSGGARGAARRGVRQLEKLLGNPVEQVIGIARDESGWIISAEVVELRRIPPTTDVLAVYDVVVDDSGELQSYEQRRRYTRGQVGEV